MKKKHFLLKLILLFFMVYMNSQHLHSQIFDADSSIKSLSDLRIEKHKMFPLSDVKITEPNDSVIVQPNSQICLDNPEAFYYRFDEKQIKSMFPEIVYSDKNNLIIDYYSLFPILFEMISNQQKQIEKLKIQIEELKKLNP